MRFGLAGLAVCVPLAELTITLLRRAPLSRACMRPIAGRRPAPGGPNGLLVLDSKTGKVLRSVNVATGSNGTAMSYMVGGVSMSHDLDLAAW